jgi:signal transduction histidine kinase
VDASEVEEERAAVLRERGEVERLRRTLLSTVSHELRTPLTLIRTSIGLLLDDRAEERMDDAMRERLLRNVKHSAERMHRLVSDMLDVARLESGYAELQVRWLDVEQLVRSVTALMQPLITDRGQELVVEVVDVAGISPDAAPCAGLGATPGMQVMGDPNRLEQVLINLLSNASKFSPAGTRVTLRVTPGAEWVTVCVADNGTGISPEGQRHLFEQFFVDRSRSRAGPAGAGLGLPIAKGLVEAHGGRLWVESALGVGSTFCFALPVAGPPRTARVGSEDDAPEHDAPEHDALEHEDPSAAGDGTKDGGGP